MTTTLTVLQEHSEVLAFWAAWGWKEERLLVFDAHLDIKAIPASRVARLDEVLRGGEDINAFNRRSLLAVPELALFGFDDFLYAAWRLGLVQQIHWVMPGVRTSAECSRALWTALECVDGIGGEAVQNWRVEVWGAQTSTGGLVIRCSDERGLLQAPNNHSQVDFDLDYFDAEVASAATAVHRVGVLLADLKLRDRVGAATLSISNGFLQAAGSVLPSLLADELAIRALLMPATVADGSILRELYRSSTDLKLVPNASCALPPSFQAVFTIRTGALAEGLNMLAGLNMDREAGWPHYEMRLALMAQRRYAEIVALPLMLEESADTPWVRAACLQAIAHCRLGQWVEANALLEQMLPRWPMLLSIYPLAKIAASAAGREELIDGLSSLNQRLQRVKDGEERGENACA